MQQDGGSGPSLDYVLCNPSLDVSCSQSIARQAEYFYQEMHLTVLETYVGSIDTVAVEIANPRCSPLVGLSSQSLKPFWKSSWLFQWPSLSPIYKPTSKTRCSQSVSSSADSCTLSQSPSTLILNPTTLTFFRIWVPAFLNLDFYIDFNRGGRTNIGIVPSIAMEQLWLTLALISASTPALMRIAKRFITSGVTLGTTYGSSRSRSASRSKEISHALASLTKSRDRTEPQTSNVDGNINGNRGGELRPDQGINTISIDAAKKRGEGASIGSTAESHVGILRKVDFDVSSETR